MSDLAGQCSPSAKGVALDALATIQLTQLCDKIMRRGETANFLS